MIGFLKGKSQTVLDISPFYETILILMNDRGDDFLSSIGHKLCNNFEREADQGNRPKIIHVKWVVNLWNECNESSVYTLNVIVPFKKIPRS